MAAKYSTLYGLIPSADSTTSGAVVSSSTALYKGPYPKYKGQSVTIAGSYDLANGTIGATNTTLHLCALPAGGRLIGCQIAPDADNDSDSDFTFDLGTIASANAYVNDSTALQAVTGFSLPATIATDAAQQVVIGASEHLVMTRAAGALNATGTIFFTATVVI